MPVLEAALSLTCSVCSGPRCAHEEILSKLLGCEERELCLDCLAFALGVDRDRFARHAVLHLKKKSCLWLPFEKVSGCDCSLARSLTPVAGPHPTCGPNSLIP